MRTHLTSFDAIRRLIRAAAAGALAGLLLASAPALAGGHDHGEGRGHDGREHAGGDPRHGGEGRWYGPPPGYPPPQAYAHVPGMPLYPHRLPPPGYGLRRGGLVPPQYRDAIVPDYGRHRLRPPPPGFAWVRMGPRYMLVSRATGQIFDVIGP